MYNTTCSSPHPNRPSFESDEISYFLHNLLNSPSSTSLLTSQLPKPASHSQHLPLSSFHEDNNRPSQLNTSTNVTDNETGSVSLKRRKLPMMESDFDDFDCESEEGVDGSEGPSSKSAPSRNSSKRSRAAEVHNLSEKRRRSRINEKMKALQNLIPNSNKTDKASMLDEAIEYLKQLQLQVQMLSMRNGFSLHPMYLPGVLQPLQLPQVGFNEGNGLPPQMTMPANPESSTQASFGLSNQCTTSNQPIVMPSMKNIIPSERSYGLDSSVQGHQGSFQLSATPEVGDVQCKNMLRQQQLYASQASHHPPGNNKMKTMTTASVLEHGNCVEASLLQGEISEGMLSKGVDNSHTLIQHLHGLQSGLSLSKNQPAR
ncbi:hypothetical protein IFM89_025481 [Coptis chinensis]|uniref:BHLH domain-containing protein n=1 Tax=Coptis chinensis TaxID=261450 RepID=A0A835HNP7_9MAGN|nr:hypothetical protein IFM89_025481 [Coptis chinensis]